MTTASATKANLDLSFPAAGVTFNIAVEPPDEGGSAPTFTLAVSDASTGQKLRLAVDVSPQLADWVRGYSRWLVRAKVKATHDESGITGTFAPDLQPEQVLQGLRDACEMIRQRFELYEESILV
ncbi:MAG: hypothetical protein IH862_04670 [Chloroflexi bacterium]|nr:hypothetical protein [Chloroflexota bacterium]